MRIDYAFLADGASVPPDSKVYVLGGGFSALHFPQLPARGSFVAVAGFRLETADILRPPEVEVKLLDGAGKLVIAPGKIQFQTKGEVPPGTEISLASVFGVNAMFGEPGKYFIEYWGQGKLMARIDLTVVELNPPQMGPNPN